MTDSQLLELAARALRIGAVALEIADDWNLPDVQVSPPSEWKLDAREKNAADGWCSTYELAQKFKEIAIEISKRMQEREE